MAFFVIRILTLCVIGAIMQLKALWHLLFSEKRYSVMSLQIKTLWRYERPPAAPLNGKQQNNGEETVPF